jgi:HEAT repeat protein
MEWRSWTAGGLALLLSSMSAPSAWGGVPLSNAAPILDEMGKQLDDPQRPVAERLQIIRAFAEWGTPQVRSPLLAVLKDPHAEIRAAAARALGWPGNREAVAALRERVETPGEVILVKAAAVHSLGRIGDLSVRALVVTATRDPDASMRQAALWSVALGGLVDPADRTPYLIQLAGDRALEAQLRAEAVRNLDSVKEERVTTALLRILESEPRLTIGLPPGQPTPEQTMALRYAQARDVAAWAAAGLGLLEAKAALPLLLKTAEDPSDFFLRLMSIRALITWNVPEAFPVLVRRLDDPLTDNRVLALMGIERLGDRAAVEPVLARITDESPAVRAQAVATLGALGDPKARPPLEALQQTEPDPNVQSALEAALSRLAR